MAKPQSIQKSQPAAIPCASVRYVKELYPRLKPMDDVIERYRDSLENLPPIVVARDGVLVDGYHRWQAHVRENAETILADNIGDLADAEIIRESIVRNSSHGQQLSRKDKEALSGKLWTALSHLPKMERETDIATLLSVSPSKVRDWTKDERRLEQDQLQEAVVSDWLLCAGSNRQIAERHDVDDKSVATWSAEYCSTKQNSAPPSRQHFDVWTFTTSDKDSGQQSYFGALPPQVIENLLWFFTEPGQTVVDLFAGSGTTIDVAKAMGRRVWASDIRGSHYSPHLPIHQHDVLSGWPDGAPKKPDLVLLDPPYWKQAAGRYSSEPNELAEMTLQSFRDAWAHVVATVTSRAVKAAYIVSPTQDNDSGTVVDHATDMLAPFVTAGWRVERRIIVPYQTQQATGQQVEWAREKRRMLKLYRDLVVLTP